MVDKLNKTIADNYPEYVQVHRVMNIAAVTWPAYGISAIDLSQMSDYQIGLIKLYISV